MEFGFDENDPGVKAEYQRYEQMCKDNLEAALASLNLLMPITLESVVALALGVSRSRCSPVPWSPVANPRLGHSRNRDLEAIRRLDLCLHCGPNVSKLGLQSSFINGK